MSVFSTVLIERLAAARSVAVLTGAGISAESGIPTFRDPGGLWEKLKPEELANFDAFMANPQLVQGWYAHRRDVVNHARPNAGHVALAELEKLYHDFTLITQNVDNLHARAGSTHVVELHGNITRNYCVSCRRQASENDVSVYSEGGLYACPECGGLIRPDVVWFGEMLPAGVIEAADAAARRTDVFLSIGTSAIVYPAAALPVTARAHGAYVAEVNIRESAISNQLDEMIVGPAGKVLPALVEAVSSARAAPKE